MKTRTLISILIPVLAVLIITCSRAPTPIITEERGGINQVTFFQAVKVGGFLNMAYTSAFTRIHNK